MNRSGRDETIGGAATMMHMRGAMAWVVVMSASAFLPPAAAADRIRLRGGGEIKGLVVTDPAAKPDTVLVQTEKSAKPLVFAKTGILDVLREAGPLDEYLARKEKLGATAQAHFDFGLWCEDAKLPGPADAQYQQAVALDPQFGPAHKKLGHVLYRTRWLTYDEQREAQGLVKHKGKWILKSEKDKLDAAAALSAEQSSWATRLKLLRRKLHDDDPATRESAEGQIAAIRDPAAIPGLLRAFAGDGDAVRIRLAQLLAAIEGPEATEALVNLTVFEPDPDVRRSMLDELVRRRDPETATRLIAALKSKDSVVIGRAAWALAGMKQISAVPRLVEALIQSEKRMVMVPVAASGGGGGGLSGSYGFAQNLSGGSSSSVPASGQQGFATVGAQGYLTGPAVAPGVVAFGASSVPVASGSNPVLAGGQQQIGRMPVKTTVRYQNGEVLKALELLTGENFGFDQPAWKKWIGTSLRVEADSPRRIPRP